MKRSSGSTRVGEEKTSPFDFLEKIRTKHGASANGANAASSKSTEDSFTRDTNSDANAGTNFDTHFDTNFEKMAAQFNQNLQAPSAFLIAMEARAPWELGAMLAAWPFLKTMPQGDGHAVIVFPGLGAGDLTTAPLRSFLSTQGYETYGWDLGLNFGPRDGVLKKSVDRVMDIHASSKRKVSLIGWSLGGLYAREFAKALPKHVRSVVTLGTPFAGDPKATNAWRFYEMVSGHKLQDQHMLAHLKAAPPMPTTSIFSRTDGVVSWPLSLQKESKTAENIEVIASHVGMGMNPIALYAVADRLAQVEGKWKPFDRTGWRQYFYRDPHRAQ